MKPIHCSTIYVLTLCLVTIMSTLNPTFADITIESTPNHQSTNDIRAYLMREATELTDKSLAGIVSLDDWLKNRGKRYTQLVEMLSLTDVPLMDERPPLNINTVGTIQQDGYKIVKLYYESLPDLYVPANLYIPDNIDEPVPAILYTCGHSMSQKVQYQSFARKFAQLGFVCLITETIQMGEVQGMHHGNYREGQFQWYSRGYTPGGVELWNSIRAVDLLSQLPEVDPQRIGKTGRSGGGAYSWFVGAIDNRVKAIAPVCGTGTIESHIHQRTVDGHCDCMMHINTHRWDVHDLGAMIAPRPLLIVSSNRDGIFSIESVRKSYNNIKSIYQLYGAEDLVNLVETPGGHSSHEHGRVKTFQFFAKHLMNKDLTVEEALAVDRADVPLLSEDELRVFVDGPLENDRTPTIQESFQRMATPPELSSLDELKSHQAEVKEFLAEKTFGAFPQEPCALDIRMEFQSENGSSGGNRVYTFAPEDGFRLKLDWRWKDSPTEDRPVLLVVKNANEGRWDSNSFVSGLSDDWNVAMLEVRGVGESGWAPEMQWHIRRAAAWAGRTVASMQVYDVMRALEALRQIEGVDTSKIAIAAQNDMSVISLYAALMDGNVHSVLIKNPPATQNAPGAKDGMDVSLEMLNCLRITDVPQVAGLLHPTQLRLIGDHPETYNWAIETAKTIGQPEAVQQISRMGDW